MRRKVAGPEPGFYWKYKHKSDDEAWVHAYYVEQLAFYTGDDPILKEKVFVSYRPLTESSFVYREGRCFDVMLPEEFMMSVEFGGKLVPRHVKIEDRSVIAELNALYEKLYGHFPPY